MLSFLCFTSVIKFEFDFEEKKKDVYFRLSKEGHGSYTGELLQSSVCQAGTREDSLTNIN